MRLIPCCFLLIISCCAAAQSVYHNYFLDSRLRFDFELCVLNDSVEVRNTEMKQESAWAGSRYNLIDTNQYGDLQVCLYDSLTGRKIFAFGYSSLYTEYKSLARKDSVFKCFKESVLTPFPINTVKMIISERDSRGNFQTLFSDWINPTHCHQQKDTVQQNDIFISNIRTGGDSENSVDIVILAEGYMLSDKAKFFKDAEHFARTFSEWDPYRKYATCLNITAVFVPSAEQLDTARSSMRNTALKAGFHTLGIDRYLMLQDMHRVRDVLHDVAYDQVCVLVNTALYGGGGIYNYLTVFTSDHPHSEFLLQHEFGHGFAFLADEYFTSSVTYVDIFPVDVEPAQPNITTLVDFERKWKSQIHDSVPVPTPNRREFAGTLGVFEGGGYKSKGVYRPYLNCTMKSSQAPGFCPVCQQAIIERIKWYCE